MLQHSQITNYIADDCSVDGSVSEAGHAASHIVPINVNQRKAREDSGRWMCKFCHTRSPYTTTPVVTIGKKMFCSDKCQKEHYSNIGTRATSHPWRCDNCSNWEHADTRRIRSAYLNDASFCSEACLMGGIKLNPALLHENATVMVALLMRVSSEVTLHALILHNMVPQSPLFTHCVGRGG